MVYEPLLSQILHGHGALLPNKTINFGIPFFEAPLISLSAGYTELCSTLFSLENERYILYDKTPCKVT